ncbi:ribosome-associated translation inhibitor RaiA [candidate division WOR-3 bacterium]|uniref:Ribosome-associated translation inhibitor RaiA n=1 Tax=candidate division TA06 bacterium TaxID=2250710 RepID=A0A660SDH6_UNCT6|nr:ribosome-associated translation inhibitor RaiA [candidate division WOR-3 bacterium]RKX68050.1 MAG: ribosome-associated translation inhibitor RaiA [candidate division TA06 bacterium]
MKNKMELTARHFDLTDNIRDFVEKKVNKLDNHKDYIINMRMILDQEKNRNHVEFMVKTKDTTFSSKDEGYDLYMAIDNVVDKMLIQLKKRLDQFESKKKVK